jgi:hypothetical protein
MKLRPGTGATGGGGGCGQLPLRLSRQAERRLGDSGRLVAHTTVTDPSGGRSASDQTIAVKRTGSGCPPAPRLFRLRINRAKFRAAAHGGSITSFPKSGPRISYRDSKPATTAFTIDRVTPGVVKGHECVVPPRRVHGKPKRCTGYQMVASVTHHDRRGRNRFHFNGNLGGAKLRPGKYAMVAIPSQHGVTGPRTTLSFRIRK